MLSARAFSRSAVFLAVLLAFSDLAVAAPQPMPATPGPHATPEPPVLTLDAFLDRVLRNSPDARALRLEDDRARTDLLEARGGFDPSLSTGYEYKTEDAKDKLNVLRSGLAVPFDVPMSPSLTLDYRRGRGSSIDPSALTSAEGETRLGVAFLPLQGMGISKRRAALRKARLAPRRADAAQAQQRNRLVLDATLAFWTWAEARRVLRINRDLLALAIERRAFVARRTRAGEAAAVDSVEAALSVVRRRGKVASARRKAEQARVKLAAFLWGDDGAPHPFRYDPPALRSRAPLTADSTTALATARARRPELQAVAVKQQQLRIEQRLARQRLRPDVKLEAQVVSYDNRLSNVNDVKLGVSIEQPLFFRGGRGEAERAAIEVQALRLKRDRMQRTIRADVEAALVALRQSRRRVALAEQRIDLARRLQQAEQRRFELGESTLFLVNQREQAFAEANVEHVAARIDALQARATYRWATGTIADEVLQPGS